MPMTLYDFVPGECIERLRKLLGSPPLALTAEGGGIPERRSLGFDQVLLVSRWEVENVIRLLERGTFVEPDVPSVR